MAGRQAVDSTQDAPLRPQVFLGEPLAVWDEVLPDFTPEDLDSITPMTLPACIRYSRLQQFIKRLLGKHRHSQL
jgi:hypothetical protein